MKKRYAFCEFCEHLTEWVEYEGAWKCVGCGVIRQTEPPWIMNA